MSGVGTGGIKFRMVVPAMPCEEGIDDDNKDPRVPGVLQALSDINRMIIDLKKQFAIFSANTASAVVAAEAPDHTLKGTDPILINGSTEAKVSTDPTISLSPAFISSLMKGEWIFGSGVDGDLTLVADTALALDANIKQYNNLTLAGYILSCNAANHFMVIRVKGTLSLGGGKIRGAVANSGSAGGTTANNGTFTGSPAGSGGGAYFSVFVFAHTITGTGSIAAAGDDGIGAGNGNSGSGVAANGAGATTGGGPIRHFGSTVRNLACGGGTAPAGTTGGTGGANDNWTRTAAQLSNLNDLDLIHAPKDTTLADGNRAFNGAGGAGGGSGGIGGSGNLGFSAGDQIGGAGGGSGGNGVYGNGGSGGNGETVAAANSNACHVSGSGGGGGGGGGVVWVVTTSAPSTLAVSSKGGVGGAGAPGVGGSGQGGGGGGGGGGMAVLEAQSGCTAALTALGGIGGAGANAGQNGGGGWSILAVR